MALAAGRIDAATPGNDPKLAVASFLRGATLETKVLLCLHFGPPYGRPAGPHAVTRVAPTGEAQYREWWAAYLPSYRLEPRQGSRQNEYITWLEPGQRVWIGAVYPESDELVIYFEPAAGAEESLYDESVRRTRPAGWQRAPITRLELPKGTTKRDYMRAAIEAVERAFKDERIEELRNSEVVLREGLDKATGTGPSSERQSATDAAAAAAATVRRLTTNPVLGEAFVGLVREATTAESVLPRIRAEIEVARKAERVEEAARLRSVLERHLRKAEESRPGTLDPVKSRSELLAARSRLGEAESEVRAAQDTLRELEKLGESVEGDSLRTAVQFNAESARALDEAEPAIRREELEAEYATGLRRKAGLLDAYSRAFGTRREQEERSALVACIEGLMVNRLEAARLGRSGAAEQAAALRREADSFSRR